MNPSWTMDQIEKNKQAISDHVKEVIGIAEDGATLQEIANTAEISEIAFSGPNGYFDLVGDFKLGDNKDEYKYKARYSKGLTKYLWLSK